MNVGCFTGNVKDDIERIRQVRAVLDSDDVLVADANTGATMGSIDRGVHRITMRHSALVVHIVFNLKCMKRLKCSTSYHIVLVFRLAVASGYQGRSSGEGHRRVHRTTLCDVRRMLEGNKA